MRQGSIGQELPGLGLDRSLGKEENKKNRKKNLVLVKYRMDVSLPAIVTRRLSLLVTRSLKAASDMQGRRGIQPENFLENRRDGNEDMTTEDCICFGAPGFRSCRLCGFPGPLPPHRDSPTLQKPAPRHPCPLLANLWRSRCHRMGPKSLLFCL